MKWLYHSVVFDDVVVCVYTFNLSDSYVCLMMLNGYRWENPLMGWTSTGDPYANLGDHTLSFDSKEAAVDFVQKHGWNFSVIQNCSFL